MAAPFAPRKTPSRTPPLNRTALGRSAESLVAAYLIDRGFSVIARNLRLGALEIDIVARRGDLVVLVEVRSRQPSAFQGPLASLVGKKQRRILAAAERFARGPLRRLGGVSRLRIDVATVSLRDGVVLDYIAGAISADNTRGITAGRRSLR